MPTGISLEASTGVLRIVAPAVGYFRLEVCAVNVSNANDCALYLIRVGAPTVPLSGTVGNFYDRALERASGNQVEFSVPTTHYRPGF